MSAQNNSMTRRRTEIAIFLSVLIVALVFAAYTNHVWEDYLITYRVSQNLAAGHGLTYTVTERVHAFTSPVGVLIPAFFNLITRNASDTLVLWLFRLISVAALALASVIMLRLGKHLALRLLPLLLLVGMPALDAKTIDFTINGQETAFMIFFLALTIYCLIVPTKLTSLKLGLAWAGLMWVRPDGFVYICGLALGFLLFHKKGDAITQNRGALVLIYLKAAALSAILYLPWIIWAWAYYGSPIPHTIIAKGLFMDIGHITSNVLSYPIKLITNMPVGDLTFLPTYKRLGGWPPGLQIFSLLSIVCAFYWLLPQAQYRARAVSFAFLISHMYLISIVPYPYPWYFPSTAFLGFFVFSHLIQKALDGSRNWRLPITIAVVTIVAVEGTLTLLSAYQMRIHQKVIEEGTRKQVGLWLKANAASTHDTVYLEPLGYIGFYSQLKMFDYPGLSSPEIVSARKKIGEDIGSHPALVRLLRPDWLVLRPNEVDYFSRIDQALLSGDYLPIVVFDSSQWLKSYNWIPGRGYFLADQAFVVFKKM